MNQISALDELLVTGQRALESISGTTTMRRPSPSRAVVAQEVLSVPERRHAAALMRINHVGEVCAQAMYEAQRLGARDPAVRSAFERAAGEEIDHLGWTRQRIDELGGRASLLNPLWYAGAFAIGWVASRLGDRASLGFMAETERQVEQHLLGHLDRLPQNDAESRAIVEQMKIDEAGHGQSAQALGAAAMPLPVRMAMKLAAKTMTTTAYYV